MAMCRRCRGDDGKELDVVYKGNVVATGALCDDCLADCIDYMDRRRVEFDELIAAGVTHADANAIMILRMEGRIARA